MLCPLPKLPPLQCRALRFSAFRGERTIGLTRSETSGKVNEQKRALRAETLKGSLHKTQKGFSSHQCFQETKENTFSEVFLGDILF